MAEVIREIADRLYTMLITPLDIADMLGIDRHDINEVSIKCRYVLEERGLTAEVCKDFREIRRWVACRAWQLIERDEADTWRDAIRRAWNEAKAQCIRLGVYV